MKYDDSTSDITDIATGVIMADWFIDGVRAVIVRGPSSFCAYLGVPESHPLAGFSYDDIPIDCHGGLTFADSGKEGYLPAGFYYYGWDYAHSGDKVFYRSGIRDDPEDKEWSLGEIKSEVNSIMYDFLRLTKLAERIKND